MPIGDPIDLEIYCRHCYYCLRGLTDDRCPECGVAFSRHNPATYSQVPAPDHWSQALRRVARWATIHATASPIGADERRTLIRIMLSLQEENSRLKERHDSLLNMLRDKQILTEDELGRLAMDRAEMLMNPDTGQPADDATVTEWLNEDRSGS